MYTITPDCAQNRVILSFEGVMEQDPTSFFAEFTEAVGRVRRTSRDWTLLVDFSKTPVMEQYRAQNTGKIFDWCEANGVVKAACIVTSVTMRMQIARVTERNQKVQFFETEQAAQRWLNAQDEVSPRLAS